jgi:2,3-dimethylmalate lyase
MAGMARTPLIADGDTGYGGLLNMRHTVRGYEAAGAAAIQLEDQEFPKKCGHTPGRRVIPMADMVQKIRVAVESRARKDFLIIARTDARTTLGLDEALRRAAPRPMPRPGQIFCLSSRQSPKKKCAVSAAHSTCP